MAMSGIEISRECEEAHDRQKKVRDVQWTVYKIGDCRGQGQEQEAKGKKKQEVVVEGTMKRCVCTNDVKEKGIEQVVDSLRELWFKLIDELPEDEPRYVVFDYVGPTKSGIFKDVMRFITWSPDTSSIKSKMIYSSTKDYLKRKFNFQKETFLGGRNMDDVTQAFDDLMTQRV